MDMIPYGAETLVESVLRWYQFFQAAVLIVLVVQIFDENDLDLFLRVGVCCPKGKGICRGDRGKGLSGTH